MSKGGNGKGMIREKTKKPAVDYITENVRKLSLWHTPTFKPLLTHDDLDSIMSTLGFVGLTPRLINGLLSKEYAFTFRVHIGTLLMPTLPYPRIDGLHFVTYALFLDSVQLCLGMDQYFHNVADLFHVRGMPLHRVYDRNDRWKRMEDDEYCVFLYRHGTLEHKVHSFSLRKYQNDILDSESEGLNSMLIHKHETSTRMSQIVPLKDIIARV